MRPVVFESADDLGLAVALDIRDGLDEARSGGRRFRLGFPTGRSCLPVAVELAALADVSWDHLTIVAYDAYCEPSADQQGYLAISAQAHYSVHGWFDRNLGQVWPEAAFRGVVRERLWVPDPSDPQRSEDELLSDPIDLLLLASGSSDGHVGFNGPGTERGARTRVIELATTTRTDNLLSYPEFTSIDDVPRFGVTLGPATLAECSRRTTLILTGKEKSESLRRVTRVDRYDESWPSTIIHECSNRRIYTDPEASRTSL